VSKNFETFSFSESISIGMLSLEGEVLEVVGMILV